MSLQRVELLIADIGGYTNFIRANRTALAHADQIVHELLEAVVRAARPRFLVSKLEGDAVFLYAIGQGGNDAWLEVMPAVHRDFHATLRRFESVRGCDCAACIGAPQLRLKAALHEGEAAMRKVRGVVELTGEDVIRVHRMLKNDVPLPEYVLMSEEVAGTVPSAHAPRLNPCAVEMEGFGSRNCAYLDLASLAGDLPPPLPRASWLRRKWATLRQILATVPYQLGVKTPLAGFRNVPP
jgi:hypothetical protein